MNRLIRMNSLYGANNYSPLPVVIQKASGVFMYDTDGKKYFDFLSSYSSVNQGHCHPKLVNVMTQQCQTLTLCSRAFHSENLLLFFKFMNKTFRYDRCLPMNTGVEAGETAIKLARLWGYEKKKVDENKAMVLMAKNNFWGRTITACSSSTDPTCYTNFGPYTPGFDFVTFNCIQSLEQKLKENSNIVAYMMEPIQGEAGIIVPSSNYLQQVRELCNKYNILLICDEVQTGIGRTGKMLASELWNVRPDLLILGKALSGGMMPVSAVLADDEVMSLMAPGMHGSTFGGNPLASIIAIHAVNIISEENLLENSVEMGHLFRSELKDYEGKIIKEVRGVGLMNALEFYNKKDANLFVTLCMEEGLLCKSTHDTTIRMCPPLTINREEMKKSLEIIRSSIEGVKKKSVLFSSLSTYYHCIEIM